MTTREREEHRGPPRRGGRPRFYARRKVCGFCVNKVRHVDFKDINMIGRYLSPQARIESRRKTGVCSKHQRGLATAIKRARYLGMLPISTSHRLIGGPHSQRERY